MKVCREGKKWKRGRALQNILKLSFGGAYHVWNMLCVQEKVLMVDGVIVASCAFMRCGTRGRGKWLAHSEKKWVGENLLSSSLSV